MVFILSKLDVVVIQLDSVKALKRVWKKLSNTPLQLLSDQKSNAYLLIEDKIIKHLTPDVMGDAEDIYDFFYDYDVPKDTVLDMEIVTVVERE